MDYDGEPGCPESWGLDLVPSGGIAVADASLAVPTADGTDGCDFGSGSSHDDEDAMGRCRFCSGDTHDDEDYSMLVDPEMRDL